MRKVIILDTSILCVWLDIPGKQTCGPTDDPWDRQRVENKISIETQNRATFVLPLASIIETGNHIAQAPHSRFELGQKLANLIRLSADEKTPWAAFSEQRQLWSPEKLIELADSWPKMAAQGHTVGDATILSVANYYCTLSNEVEILTGDRQLKAYQPLSAQRIPRRKQRRS